MLRALACVAAAAAFLAYASTSGAMTQPKLSGTTGPGFSIKLTMNGKGVKTLKAGTYTLTVNDKAAIHDFHLIGPGISKVVTGVGFVGTKSVTVTLKKGKYTFQCDPHAASGMKGSFTVS